VVGCEGRRGKGVTNGGGRGGAPRWHGWVIRDGVCASQTT